MTTQPIEPPSEQNWLGNIAREQNLEALRHAAVHGVPFPTLPDVERHLTARSRAEELPSPVSPPAEAPKEHYLYKGHLLPVANLRSPDALALMRTRIHTQALLDIAEKQSAQAEAALQLALAVEDQARAEVLKATEAIDEFARQQACA